MRCRQRRGVLIHSYSAVVVLLATVSCGDNNKEATDQVESLENDQIIDSDNDNIPDEIESFLGYSPTEADTDSDMLSDYAEFITGTSATVSDSDGDGLSDYDELLIYNTDPLAADTDMDGIVDGKEVLAATSPTEFINPEEAKIGKLFNIHSFTIDKNQFFHDENPSINISFSMSPEAVDRYRTVEGSWLCEILFLKTDGELADFELAYSSSGANSSVMVHKIGIEPVVCDDGVFHSSIDINLSYDEGESIFESGDTFIVYLTKYIDNSNDVTNYTSRTWALYPDNEYILAVKVSQYKSTNDFIKTPRGYAFGPTVKLLDK